MTDYWMVASRERSPAAWIMRLPEHDTYEEAVRMAERESDGSAWEWAVFALTSNTLKMKAFYPVGWRGKPDEIDE